MNQNLQQPRRRNRNRNRARNSEMNMLTGGTRDVKPELMSFVIAESAADTTTTLTLPMPTLRNFSGAGGNKAQIVEVLKVWFDWSSMPEVDSSQTAILSTKNFSTTSTFVSDPAIIAFSHRQVAITTSGQYAISLTDCFDLTDGNGNGVLVATDNLYVQVYSSGIGAAVTIRGKILYRIYAASVLEYVGIVQGQQ